MSNITHVLVLVAMTLFASDPELEFPCEGSENEKLQALKERLRASLGDLPIKAERCHSRGGHRWQSVVVWLQEKPFVVELTATSSWASPNENTAFMATYLERVRA